MPDASKCDMNMLPFFIGYPYFWNEAYKMFEPNGVFEVSKFIRSYTVHYNSKITEKYEVTGNDNSIMEFLMRHNCPIVFNTIKTFEQYLPLN